MSSFDRVSARGNPLVIPAVLTVLFAITACRADPTHPKEFIGKWLYVTHIVGGTPQEWKPPQPYFDFRPDGSYSVGDTRDGKEDPFDKTWEVHTDSATRAVTLCTNPKGTIGRPTCSEVRLEGDVITMMDDPNNGRVLRRMRE